MPRHFIAAALSTLAISIGAAPATVAQESSPQQVGQHIVRPGDTLEAVTKAYLGNSGQWRDNWKLNPQIKDPNRLTPGQRLRVLLAPGVAVPSARIQQLAGQVDERPSPIPWNPALESDLLLERDGLRTSSQSSSELVFADDTRLVLTEDSLVFLRRAGATLAGEQRTVEIVEGQADLESSAQVAQGSGVEIIVAQSRTRPQGGGEGGFHSRSRVAASGGSQLMVFSGTAEADSADTKVVVGEGMGTSIPENGPPAPPVELLKSPEIITPVAASEWQSARPTFLWEPVTDAASYNVEVCHDPRCAKLVVRAHGVEDARWRPEGLPIGSFHWRVTGVSADGLDGYSSAPAAFSILTIGDDLEAPLGRVVVEGNQTRVGKTLYVDSKVTLDAEVEDPQSGVDRWMPKLNGARVEPKVWQGPWSPGSYAATATALDRAGNIDDIQILEFVVDDQPPSLAWSVVESRVSAGAASPFPRRMMERWQRRDEPWLEWSVDGLDWRPLVWGDQERSPILQFLAEETPSGRPAARHSRLSVTSDHPQVMLRAPGGRPFATTSGVQLHRGEMLVVTAHDDGARVEQMSIEARPATGGGYVLELSTSDQLGHRQVVEWPLAGL